LCSKSPQEIEKKEVECRKGTIPARAGRLVLGDSSPVEEEKRLHLAGSQLSGKILEKVEIDPERFRSEAVASSSCRSVARQGLTVKEYY
jgi:hypothetical protein